MNCGVSFVPCTCKKGEGKLLNQPVQFTATVIGSPVPFKDIENDVSTYVVRMLLDQPFKIDNRMIPDVFIEVDPAEFIGEVGERIAVEGIMHQRQVITRSGKSGRQGIIHVTPRKLEYLDSKSVQTGEN
jgi:hypothetical protein